MVRLTNIPMLLTLVNIIVIMICQAIILVINQITGQKKKNWLHMMTTIVTTDIEGFKR